MLCALKVTYLNDMLVKVRTLIKNTMYVCTSRGAYSMM